jgi:hypothetical protein
MKNKECTHQSGFLCGCGCGVAQHLAFRREEMIYRPFFFLSRGFLANTDCGLPYYPTILLSYPPVRHPKQLLLDFIATQEMRSLPVYMFSSKRAYIKREGPPVSYGCLINYKFNQLI